MIAQGLKAAKALVLKLLAILVYRRDVLVERELRNHWVEPSSDISLRVRRLHGGAGRAVRANEPRSDHCHDQSGTERGGVNPGPAFRGATEAGGVRQGRGAAGGRVPRSCRRRRDSSSSII